MSSHVDGFGKLIVTLDCAGFVMHLPAHHNEVSLPVKAAVCTTLAHVVRLCRFHGKM